MDHQISNADFDDLPMIYSLFDEAILFQQTNKFIGWKNYDKEFIRAEINNGVLFKVVMDNNIACIFSVCYSDPLIWRGREKGDAIYLHRVVLNQRFKGIKVFPKILAWTLAVAQNRRLNFIRLDTWADNAKLIAYYKAHGFSFVENYTTPSTEDLPVQHRNLKVALLSLPVPALQKIKIREELSHLKKYWSQKIIGKANGQLIKIAKGTGEVNWHKHDDQDELFILYKGHLTIQLRSKDIELYPDELFIVPKGVEHCPISHGDSEFLIIGLNITSNTAGGRPANADLLTP